MLSRRKLSSGRLKKHESLLVYLTFFIIAIMSISLLYRDNIYLTAVLLIGSFVVLKFSHRKDNVRYFAVAAAIGPAAEIVAVRFGVWSYTNPTILGIPAWLPIAYGLAGVLLKRLAELLTSK